MQPRQGGFGNDLPRPPGSVLDTTMANLLDTADDQIWCDGGLECRGVRAWSVDMPDSWSYASGPVTRRAVGDFCKNSMPGWGLAADFEDGRHGPSGDQSSLEGIAVVRERICGWHLWHVVATE